MRKYYCALLLIFVTVTCCPAGLLQASDVAHQRRYLDWKALPELPDALGVAGPFVGVHNDALIVAGGANFPRPVWNSKKRWLDRIWVLVKRENYNAEKREDKYRWLDGGRLEQPVAYGASVSTKAGIVCIGGNNSKKFFSRVFCLKWNPVTKQVKMDEFPSLPRPCAFASAAIVGDIIYVAGGQSDPHLSSAMKNFWSLDLSCAESGTGFAWKELLPWPGPSRAFNLTVAQHNGKTDCVYVISGRRIERGVPDSKTQFLNDVYEFTPADYDPGAYDAGTGLYTGKRRKQMPWQKKADAPECLMAGAGIGVGQSHVFVLSGANGSLFFKADELKDSHPGFPRNTWIYHTITDTWIKGGRTPANQVTTIPVKWGGSIILACGEVRPRVRSPKVWKITPVETACSFGVVNFCAIIIYLAAMIGVGVFFSFRNKNTDDFFRGGQRVPWWAAGLSIFATMLSSITFVAIPAKAYASNWVFFIFNMTIVLMAPFIVFFVLPFFRKIDATSAYEYLEKRFNVLARLFASGSFVFFQVGRMAIVMYLPALVLSVITPLTVIQCILVMGVMSIIYCTLGGLEAVIWTDTIQSFVLLGGAFLSFVLIVLSLHGGFGEFFSIGFANHKFHMINWDWDSMSFATTAFWVVLLGGIGQNLVPYSSDQSIIQRYVSTPDEKKAAKAIWLNAVTCIPASLIFFGVGTALFVFYKTHPSELDPTFKTDAIFPLFIARKLPVGIAGIVVAGIFAAAQSTISTSMNSLSTAVVTDFVRRFNLIKSERSYLNLARFMTFAFGCLGTGLAILFAVSDIRSAWEVFMKILGLFGGSMCGLFILGIFTKQANTPGALFGALFGACGLFLVQKFTGLHGLLYAAVGITFCCVAGYLASFILPAEKKDISGLTIYTIRDRLCKGSDVNNTR